MSEESMAIFWKEGESPEPIDLVVYFGDERLVVGQAVLSPDGKFTAKINDEIDKRAAKVMGVIRGEFTFRIPRSKLIPDLSGGPAFTGGELPFDGNVPEQPEDLVLPVDRQAE